MSEALIRAQIKAVVEAVSGAGMVYSYQRWASEYKAFLTLFKDTGDKINGWVITRLQSRQNRMTQGEKERAHIYALRKYYGLNDADASELTFNSHIEAVVNAFNSEANESLNDTCLTINPDWGPMSGAVGLQVEIIDMRMFGSVLCHFADCRLGVIETISD